MRFLLAGLAKKGRFVVFHFTVTIFFELKTLIGYEIIGH